MCNTLNVCCIPAGASRRAGARGSSTPSTRPPPPRTRRRASTSTPSPSRTCPPSGSRRRSTIRRADGEHIEPAATLLDRADLGTEWEWEDSPEVSLVVTESVDEAVALCNRYSPRFVASLISDDGDEQERFYAAVDAPFVGDGFTRWVDGQYALDTPELGLSNWQFGRLLGRGGVLSGDSIHTIRHRATIDDPTLRR